MLSYIMLETSSNKIVFLPNDKVQTIGKGVIVKETDKCCKLQTEAGLIISDTGNVTKKYDIGEVIAVGKDVMEVKIGDVVLFQTAGSVAFPLPNGMDKSILTKIDESPLSIMCVIPKDCVDKFDSTLRVPQ